MDDAELLKTIGTKIKAARTAKQYSLQELAQMCGMQKANLSRIESGQTNVSILTLKKIANCLNVGIHSFFPTRS